MKKINLCCGTEILNPDEWDNYDRNPYNKDVKYIDLNNLNNLKKYFKPDSVDVFRLDNAIEHLKPIDYEIVFELKKYLKKGGYIDVIVPSDSNQILHIKYIYSKHYFTPLKANYHTDYTTSEKDAFTRITYSPFKFRGFSIIYYILERFRKLFWSMYRFKIYK